MGARTVMVIQARMGSTRLPGKVLMPFAGAPMLQRLIERVVRSRLADGPVVATTVNDADDPIADLCARLGVACHRGSDADVLARVQGAAEATGAEVVVRLTADNPFVDGVLVDRAVAVFREASPPVDYAHTVDGSGFAYGLFVEVVSMRALGLAARVADEEEREHVTLFLRRHPELFRAAVVRAPGRFAYNRLTVDTPDEYVAMRALFERLYAADPAFGTDALLPAVGAEARA